jgi:hypothetical protein
LTELRLNPVRRLISVAPISLSFATVSGQVAWRVL